MGIREEARSILCAWEEKSVGQSDLRVLGLPSSRIEDEIDGADFWRGCCE